MKSKIAQRIIDKGEQPVPTSKIDQINFRLSRIEDRLEFMTFKRSFFDRLRLIPMRNFLQLCISLACLAITYKIIVW